MFAMLKPSPAARELIAAMPMRDRSRAAELLHMTIIPLPYWGVSRLCAVLDDVVVRMFPVRLNRLVWSGKSVSLRGPAPGLAKLRSSIGQSLTRYAAPGFDLQKYDPPAHVTLAYDANDAPDGRNVAPIEWMAEDFCLIESVTGEARHVEHGRWRLLPRPQDAQLSLIF